MKKLDKLRQTERDILQEKLQSCYDELDTAVDAYNKAMEEAWKPLAAILEDFNFTIEEANSWRQDVASDIQTYMDERSEKWLEGDKGQAYASWRDEYDGTYGEVSLAKPDGLDIGDVENYNDLMSELREEIG